MKLKITISNEQSEIYDVLEIREGDLTPGPAKKITELEIYDALTAAWTYFVCEERGKNQKGPPPIPAQVLNPVPPSRDGLNNG